MEKRINDIGSYLIIGGIFIIPLIFSASATLSFQFAKFIPFFLITFAAAFLFIVHIFNEGKVSVPRHWFFLAAASVPLIYIISSFTSINPGMSLWGTGIELGTASTIAGLFLFMYLASFFIRSKDKAFLSYLAFGAAYFLLAVFHIFRFFFGADFLSFGLFTNVISNTVGRFSDLAIISGVAVLLSLTSIEFLKLGRALKLISYVTLAASLVVLGVSNFPLFIWGTDPKSSLSIFTLIGLFALIFFVYFVSSSYGITRKKSDEDDVVPTKTTRRVPVASLVVLIVSIISTLGATSLQTALSSAFKIEPTIEARLLWEATTNLSGSTLSEFSVRPFLGYGPEQFSYKWMIEKPVDINNSILWNSSFNYGTGFIPSTIVTTGLLGFLAWVAFLGMLLWLGLQALFMKIKDPFSHYILVSSFLASVYLWITAIVYIPSITTFILTFFFTGVFVGSLLREKVIEERETIFDQSKGRSFAFILALIFLLILLLFWGFKLGERVAASAYANKAALTLSNAQNMEDVERAKVYLRNAGVLANEALYSRALATLTLAQVNAILADTTTPVEELRQQFQTTYQDALGYSQLALARDQKSFDNFVTYGNVLAVGVPLGLEGYYEEAKAAYEEAGKLNPKSPLVPYLLAQLEVNNKNIDQAKAKIGEALQLKPNYVDAIVFLGRIQIGEGRNQDALASFTVAQSLLPDNPDIKAVIDMLRNGDTSLSPTPEAPATDAATSTATSTTN